MKRFLLVKQHFYDRKFLASSWHKSMHRSKRVQAEDSYAVLAIGK